MMSPFRDVGKTRLGHAARFIAESSEETELSGFFSTLSALAGLDCPIDCSKRLSPTRAQGIEGSSANQAFESALIERPGIDALRKIKDRLERAGRSGLND